MILAASITPTETPPVLDPEAYVVDVQVVTCSCCHSRFEMPTCYAKATIPTWARGARAGTHLHFLPWPRQKLFNLPINIFRSKPRTIPFCHKCNQPSLAHYDAPPTPATVVGTSAPKAPEGGSAGSPSATHPKPTKRAATIDDLLI